jgi:uncharacterized repeat protein (TIGR01451 family)
MKACFRWIVLALLATCSLQSHAQTAPISRYTRLTGNLNFVTTGGSLRTESNDDNYCAVGPTSSGALNGIPVGASIVAAYLYWGGSGATTDTSVSLNGGGVSASRTFTVDVAGPTRTFFGGFADVTARVSGNATFTFGGLTVDAGGNYCSSATVVAGWGLVVIYSSPSEPLRAINVFDGLETFYGSSLTLTPNGFRIPPSGYDGKMAVITWDGDPGNSGASGSFSESLRFNGTALDDGVVAPGSSPTTQQYDGTINTLALATSYGVDVDTYTVTSLLTPGATSATTVYSAGLDRVFLTAQIVSVTSQPIVDLALTKTHSGDFSVGSNATYTLTVTSEPGSQPTDFPIVVTDTLPAGLTYASASGAGWSCSATGQTVTCTHPGPLNAGASLPVITLNAAVGNAAYPSVTNTAQVTTPSNDPDSANNTASDPATVLGPNISTSTKSVQDLNGGDANPGDTLRYTITVTETAGVPALGVIVTDDVPANVTGFAVNSIPAGATNASTGAGTGAGNTGFLNISGVNVPANGSATIVFDVQVAAGAAPGATIDNTATIDNQAGADATPSTPQIIVSQSQIPASGTKPLYLWSNPDQRLSRTQPSGSHPAVTLAEGATTFWTLSPTLSTPVTLAAGGMAVDLYLAESGSGSSRSLQVTLSNTALGNIASANYTTTLTGAAAQRTITLNVPASVTAPAGSAFRLTIANTTSGSGSRTLLVYPLASPGAYSRVSLNSLSVINVDSVTTYNAPSPGGVATSSFAPGATIYVRSVVSDPFGSFDITGANVTILDPASNVQVNNVAMTAGAVIAGATRTFEYAYAAPASAATGAWTVRVVAREGVENTVTDLGVGGFSIARPTLQVLKTSAVISDPVNNTVNPKNIPGSVRLYTVRVTNLGAGVVDANTLAIADAVPANTRLWLADVGAPGSGPLAFMDGTPSSALSYVFLGLSRLDDDLEFSSNGGLTWTYIPSPDASGQDPAITHIRVRPQGTMAGASGGNPWFELRFRVQVQ